MRTAVCRQACRSATLWAFMRSLLLPVAVALAACSPSAELASSVAADRVFDADCPTPGATSGADTFDAIYNELLSDKGVAGCQNGACHGGAAEQGGLRMKTTAQEAYDGMKDYGLIFPDSTMTAEPGQPPPQVSGLIRVTVAIAPATKPKMPRELCGNRPLNAAEIERIKRWGAAGAKFK